MNTIAMGPFGQEAALSRAMVKSWFDFGKCNDKDCIIGGNEGSPRWPEYSSSASNSDSVHFLPYKGARIVWQIPTSKIRISDDSGIDQKCELFESVMASKSNPTAIHKPRDDAHEKGRTDNLIDKFFMKLNTFVAAHVDKLI
jgi:hypothetical protein